MHFEILALLDLPVCMIKIRIVIIIAVTVVTFYYYCVLLLLYLDKNVKILSTDHSSLTDARIFISFLSAPTFKYLR